MTLRDSLDIAFPIVSPVHSRLARHPLWFWRWGISGGPVIGAAGTRVFEPDGVTFWTYLALPSSRRRYQASRSPLRFLAKNGSRVTTDIAPRPCRRRTR